MVQALALTVQGILTKNWLLGTPIQYPSIVTTGQKTGVDIEAGSIPEVLRTRQFPVIEVKEPDATVRPISDVYWQYDSIIEVKVWTRAQDFNQKMIGLARLDKNNIREEIKKIIHSNLFNPVLEDDGITPVTSWMWIERESNRDDIDKAQGMDYPILTSTLKIHIMYLRQQGFEIVSAEVPAFPTWDQLLPIQIDGPGAFWDENGLGGVWQ